MCLGAAAAKPLTELTAVEAVDLLCRKKITAVQYASALLDRSGELQCLNTFATLDTTQVGIKLGS